MAEPDRNELFLFAAMYNKVERMEELLESYPDLDVNYSSSWDGYTALHWAAMLDHKEALKLLLAHPRVDVNAKCTSGCTPLAKGICEHIRLDLVELFVNDARTDLDAVGWRDESVVWTAVHRHRADIVDLFVASGREFDVRDPAKGAKTSSALYSEDFETHSRMADFIVAPVRARHEARIRLGHLERAAAGFFALVVSTCDGLLRIQPRRHPRWDAEKFLSIVTRLPMELQMLACLRVCQSSRTCISAKDTERALRELARTESQS